MSEKNDLKSFGCVLLYVQILKSFKYDLERI
ncbi:hypothetical protein Rahaq_3606 [Rahnella aceris]|jgi:hypothetical protein|uniref:Uncharacterized protein n=1 Tax=Rahnella sp. (strain Y9602) TaxID=2703885 RepID=A0A0H3FDS7_RAHSY|nr:hypothetical protein Rahaq_3606 [Rahnella aceris]MDP9703375.1 hypothetical protein [Rahnella aquatilis]RKT76161.1 hypothetical protein BJ925_2688 [Rahnella aquatilis]